MASIILGEIASSVGGSLFGSVGSAVGLGFGNYFGKQIDNSLMHGKSKRTEGHRLQEINIQTASYGKAIPIIYGTVKIAGNIIWASKIEESFYVHSRNIDVFGINKAKHNEYNYTISLAIALCEGEIDEITRVWANGKLLPLHSLNCRIYKGTEEQLPDPLIEGFYGMNKTPAYRGIAYIVIEDLALKQFNMHIPNFSFEIKRKMLPDDKNQAVLEQQIDSMVIIPGSGEFVYDTQTHKKVERRYINNKWIEVGKVSNINQNNNKNIADAELSLRQLKDVCPNLKWTAPVAGWFANSNNLKVCSVKPGAEYKNNVTIKPEMWRVGNFSREDAYEISKDQYGNPNYGGTTSDTSILRYLERLKEENYKIMFYPMLFMDTEGKPWRGRLTGEADEIKNFFRKSDGYNNFILHYANLVKGKIDAFVIGSELIGLTKVRDKNNNFPAVDELCELAKQVKHILGKGVVVTYAADWSEYHHTDGGWYNLDKLWACDSIDVIGIDAYFPLTDEYEEQYDADKIKQGWESGEGYDYYINDNKKFNLDAPYAWKNIEYWWNNYHYNPDGNKTLWQPRSKKIWFTEIGFPSVDCASNQPNVFYDPNTKESSLPKNSNGGVDFIAQRVALSASLKKWQNSEIVERMFVWCWDARPYPFWPDLEHIWSDYANWSRGHWLNGKLGIAILSSIIEDICKKAGLTAIDVYELFDQVEGLVISEQTTAQDILENLQKIYFFDLCEIADKIKFNKRVKKKAIFVDHNDMVITKDGKGFIEKVRTKAGNLPKTIKIVYFNRGRDYETNVENVTTPIAEINNIVTITTPQILSTQKAQLIARAIIDNFWNSRVFYIFTVPMKYIDLNIGDLIKILDPSDDKFVTLRILKATIQDKKTIEINAVIDDLTLYKMHLSNNDKFLQKPEDIEIDPGDTKLHIFKVPKLLTNNSDKYLIAAEGIEEQWNGAKVICPDGDIMDINNNVIGLITKYKQGILDISITQGSLFSLSQDDQCQVAYIDGGELIKFSKVVDKGSSKYELDNITRAAYDTNFVNDLVGKKFILLDSNIKAFDIPMIEQKLKFMAISNSRKMDKVNNFYV